MGIGSSMVGTIPNIISIIIWDRGDGVLFIAKKLLLGVSLDKVCLHVLHLRGGDYPRSSYPMVAFHAFI